MKPTHKFVIENPGVKVTVTLFCYDTNVTMAKLAVKANAYDDVKEIYYGWAYRSPEDRPSKKRGMRVALEKALNASCLAPKPRHEILTTLGQLHPPKKPAISTDEEEWFIPEMAPKLLTKEKCALIYHSEWNSIYPIEILCEDQNTGRVSTQIGGFGLGLQSFFFGSVYEDPGPPNGWAHLQEHSHITILGWRFMKNG